MAAVDLNLLIALEVLLDERSVVGAARRLGLSPSAVSRTLARLRAATGDPLLARAGRALVATPRALELRDRVGPLVREVEGVLRPDRVVDLAALERTFTLRTSEGFVETFGAALVERLRREAPGVRLRFVPKADRGSEPLRDGSVDLETGVVGRSTGPETMVQALFRDRFVGVVRDGHALLRGRMTAERYAAARHVGVSRAGRDVGPIERALEPLRLARDLAVEVGGYASALALVRATDLVATVPERHTEGLRARARTFPLPFEVPGITVSLLWHPRLGADPAHRWLRHCVHEVCAGAGPRPRRSTSRAGGGASGAPRPRRGAQ